MRLDSAAIEEFKKIYQEEFLEVLSQAEAEEMASRVVRLYELLARPLPSERADAFEKSGSSIMLEVPSAVPEHTTDLQQKVSSQESTQSP